MEISDFVLCVGVGKAEQGVYLAHLLRLDDLNCALTRPWQSGEEFMAGKWYKKNKSRKYEQIGDVVPTMVVQKIDINNAEKKTMLELVLPVFFPPDLGNLNPYGQIPALSDRNAFAIPICPLFGPDGTKCLPPVAWSKEQIGQYSNQLYALKINLSYSISSLPQWTHLNTSQLKPWNFEESPIVKELCMESRTEGLLLNGICGLANAGNSKLSFMLNKQAELAIAVFPERKCTKSSEYREYWPINIFIYECPVTIALDCPQSVRNFDENFVLRKLIANKFEITFKGENALENLSTNYPWLGRIMDPFYCLLDAQAKGETFTKMQATVFCHLGKRSVAWTVMAIMDQGNSSCENLLDEKEEIKKQITKERDEPEDKDDKKLISSSNLNLNISAVHNSVASKKTAIAVFMTLRYGVDGNAVFLFWDKESAKFTQKCYAEFHNSINFDVEFGKWFELTYLEKPNNQTQIIVFDFKEIKQFAVTRVRDKLCAQFSTNRDRFVNVWHSTFPCKEKSNYFEDKGWWPWLCRKCFPNLRELSPPPILGGKKEDDLTEDAHSVAESDGKSSAKGNGIREVPIVQKQSADRPTTNVLGVLFTVRDVNGGAVFLIYDESMAKFTFRIYADPPKRITGNPQIGRWYWLKCKLNSALQDGQNINVLSVENYSKPLPAKTRVKYGIAQFNTQLRLMLTWHKAKQHKRGGNEEISSADDGPWWPHICFVCFPDAKKSQITYVNVEKNGVEGITKSANSSAKNVDDKSTTQSETSSEEEETRNMEMNNGRRNLGGPNKGNSISERPNAAPNNRPFTANPRPPPISIAGNIFRPAKSSSPNIQSPGVGAISGTNQNGQNRNSPAGSAQNGAGGSSENSQPQLTGGFGMARSRRHQMAATNSTYSLRSESTSSTLRNWKK